MKTHEKGHSGALALGAWFAVLEAADSALHNAQGPLRELELPKYPGSGGGSCGCHNLVTILRRITEAQVAIRGLEQQLRAYVHFNSP